jgi:Ala-tRNA(Pro) deacylase
MKSALDGGARVVGDRPPQVGRVALSSPAGLQDEQRRSAMSVRRLQDFLDSHHLKYVTIRHSLAYTAQEIAASAHISGKQLAKTVIVKLDGKPAMAVLPASDKVNFERLKEVAGANTVALAREQELQDLFPECEVGAMPPFGNLYGMEVWVAERLAEDEEIAFNAGDHTELIRMAYRDFARLVTPKVAQFSTK